jgi:hypothetical protein
VLGGGLGVWAGAWLIAIVVFVIVFALIARERYPSLVGSVDRLGTELTETYAKIEQANREIEAAKASRGASTTGNPPTQLAARAEDRDARSRGDSDGP